MGAALPRVRPPIELVRPSFYYMLVSYYGAIVGYALTTILLGVLSIEQTVSREYAYLWSASLMLGALLAGGGAVFSARFKTHWLELIGTILIMAELAGYAVAIVIYAADGGESARYSAVWLPVILAILPIYRIAVMSVDGSLTRRREPDEPV